MRALVLPAALLVLRSPLAAQPRPADHDSPEGLVRALYQTVQRPAGARYDWPRLRSLFLPSARLLPNTEQTRGVPRVLTVDEFAAWVDSNTVFGGPSDRGFAEEEVAAIYEKFGDVVHAFSTYQKHFRGDTRILGRGINSIQMVHRNGRWWIASLAWDEEAGAGPLPERYRPSVPPPAHGSGPPVAQRPDISGA